MQVFRFSEILSVSIFKEKKNNIAVSIISYCVVYVTTLSAVKNVQGGAEVT
jgi:hypothetical protein